MKAVSASKSTTRGGARQLRGIPKIVRSAFVTVVLLLSLQTIVVPTFLNFDKRYPDQIFTLVIWGGDRSKFGDPETVYRGKRACVTGKISVFKGVPEVVANEPAQIKLH
jgi:hypothetical protein